MSRTTAPYGGASFQEVDPVAVTLDMDAGIAAIRYAHMHAARHCSLLDLVPACFPSAFGLTRIKNISRNADKLIHVVLNIHCIEPFKEINMSYEDRDQYGMYKNDASEGPGPELMGAHTLLGEDVYNHKDEDLGDIKEIMLDIRSGRISYAVLSFGGFLGMGEKLFAVPWNALTLDTVNKRFILKVEKERLKDAPGFDLDDWPDMASPEWSSEIHTYYGTQPYSDDRVI